MSARRLARRRQLTASGPVARRDGDRPARRPNLAALTEPLEGRRLLSAAYALDAAGTSLLRFDTATPGSIDAATPITGVSPTDALAAIDFRPQNGLLYGLGVNATADTATLYAISTRTGVAGVVGTAGGIAFTTNGSTVVDLPDPATVGYGFDFNPAADRVRVTTANGLNFRVNPNTGVPLDGDGSGSSGSVTGVNPDGPINGSGVVGASGAAYTNDQPNNGNVTTLYTLDEATNALSIQNPPNAGTQTAAKPLTLGGSPLDFSAVGGFDILPGVNAPAGNAAVTAGSGLATLTVGGVTGLYSVDLVTAQAALVGPVGGGAVPVRGLALQSPAVGFPAVALSADGQSLVRFNTASPGTTTTNALAPLQGNEQLAGIDYRPQTGQLYGLGVNATANTATLYLIDPQVGAATVVGSVGAIAFTTDGTTAVDLPDPGTVGYGFDFNPTVDRVRVTTGSGLNFRVNPVTAVAVDGDSGGAVGSVVGTNPDGPVNGSGVVGVSSAGYTNSFGQAINGAGSTTLYTLDAATDVLAIQNPANAGTQTNPLPVTVNGAALDFTGVNGFDVPAVVSVGASGTAASGYGVAALTVGGSSRLYLIDLATGAAFDRGPVGAGTTPLGGLTLGDGPAPMVVPSVAVTDVAGVEGDVGQTPFVFTLTRTGDDLSVTSTVDFFTSEGTATSGTDYQSAAGSVLFLPGQVTRTITVFVNGDTKVGSDETFFVNLVAPFNLLVPDAQAVGTIVEDDVPPPPPQGSAYSVNDVSKAEGQSGMTDFTFTVKRTGNVSAAGSVRYQTIGGSAASGTDFTAKPLTTLAFAAGQASRTVTVSVVGGTLFEDDEQFTLKLSNPAGGATIADGTGVGTIVNDDPPPSLSVNDVTSAEGNSGTKTFTFTVTMSRDSGRATTVKYATAFGSANSGDLTAASGTLPFAAGQTSKTVTVTVKGDKTKEADETFFLNLSAPAGATIADGQGKGTIKNDD